MSLFLMCVWATPPEKARLCSACHGERGISANDHWPNIAGQKEQYLIQQLREFKAGRRENEVMSNIAKQLTHAEILELAAHYSSLRPAE